MSDKDYHRPVYTRESNGTTWFVAVIAGLALLSIGYLIYSVGEKPIAQQATVVESTPA